MANKRTSSSNNAGNGDEKKNTKPCNCMDCLHSLLHQYGTNPILSACQKQPQPGNDRFPYMVIPASFIRVCPMYKHDANPKTVEQRSKVA